MKTEVYGIGDEKITKPYAAIGRNEYGGFNGYYVCCYGIVIIDFNVYNSGPYTLLRFAYQGRMYRKNIKGPYYTKIGLARKAGEFVKEVLK
jgi:hypothetical protein